MNILKMSEGWVDQRNPWGPTRLPSLALWMGWLFTNSWRGGGGVGGWGQKQRRKWVVKGYCLLNFWTWCDHLIHTPHFTDGKQLEQVTWKDNLLFFCYIVSKFPRDIQSPTPMYSPRLVERMQCLPRCIHSSILLQSDRKEINTLMNQGIGYRSKELRLKES